MSQTPIRILIADSCLADRERCKRFLLADKQRQYVVFEAACAQAACDQFVEHQPQCVLLDHQLPDADGLDLLPRFTAAGVGGVPSAVVMLTEGGSEATAVEAFRGGALDYLSKSELTAERLQACIQRVLVAVETLRRSAQKSARLRQFVAATQAQLEVAQRIQQRLLPASAPRIRGFDIAGRCLPSQKVGGDFFDYVTLPNGLVGIAIADVSGHGLGQAIMAAETRAYLRSAARICCQPAEVLPHVNELLCADMGGELYVTLALVCLEPGTRRLCFASAGHRSHLLTAAGATRPLEIDQPPLGIAPHFIQATQAEVRLNAGDVLLLTTDGLIESCQRNGAVARSPSAGEAAMFGIERLLATARANRDRPAAEIVQTLFHAVQDFHRDPHRDDDMTAVVVKIL